MIKQQQQKIIINYVTPFLDKHFYLEQPQVEYLKLPEYPLQIHSFANGKLIDESISLNVKTDGERVIYVELIDNLDDIYNDDNAYDDEWYYQKYHKLNKTEAKFLLEFATENIKTWHFRKHAPANFSVTWRYVIGEVINDIVEIDETLYDILETDTATLSLPRNVEIVMFPKTDFDHTTSSNESANSNTFFSNNTPPHVEYLKIPAPQTSLRYLGRNEVTLKVKTDGEKAISVEAIKFFQVIHKNEAIENIKTWRFKKHDPTEFITHWIYDSESHPIPKPDIITLELPYRVEIKLFRVPEIDPIKKNKVKINK
jgi:hypothetical protein